MEHFLAPTPKEGQIVVVNNLQVHKSAKVREIIEGVGAEVLFLPPQSPDLDPIGRSVLEGEGHPAPDRSPHS